MACGNSSCVMRNVSPCYGGGVKLRKTIIIFKVTDTNTKCFVCSTSSENVRFNLTSHFSGCVCVCGVNRHVVEPSCHISCQVLVYCIKSVWCLGFWYVQVTTAFVNICMLYFGSVIWPFQVSIVQKQFLKRTLISQLESRDTQGWTLWLPPSLCSFLLLLSSVMFSSHNFLCKTTSSCIDLTVQKAIDLTVQKAKIVSLQKPSEDKLTLLF